MTDNEQNKPRVIFEYPSEFEADIVANSLGNMRNLQNKTESKSYVLMLASMVFLIISLATDGTLSSIFFAGFVISTALAYIFRHIPKKAAAYNFVTAYDTHIHIVSYASDLLARTEALVFYDDIIKAKFRKNILKMLIYETGNSIISRYNSSGELVENTTVFTCKISKGSEIETFLLEIAPTLFL